MTSVEFLKLCARRWYILLAGLAATLAVAFLAAGPNVVYFTRTTVNVLEPDRAKQRIVGFHSPDAIAVANILVARVNNGVKTPLASDPDVPLYSMGILQGTHAQVRNIGGQWLSQVTEPVVDVQSVAATPEQAKAQLAAEVHAVGTQLAALEDELKVPAADRIQLTLNPSQPSVDRVDSPRSRSLVGYTLAGTAATLVAVWWGDRLLTAYGRRRKARPVQVSTPANA